MEDTLEDLIKNNNDKWTKVLILVLMEDTLEAMKKFIIAALMLLVLILVLMEDTLEEAIDLVVSYQTYSS